MPFYDKGIIDKQRLGTVGDPYIDIVEDKTIKNSRACLSEIPDYPNHVTAVNANDANNIFSEIFTGTPSADQFKVNYNLGTMDFNITDENKLLTFTYKGTGAQYFPFERIWTQLDTNGDVTATFEDLAESAMDSIAIVGTQIETDKTAVFANSASANTVSNIDITKPSYVKSTYAISVYNPSTVSALTITLLSAETTMPSTTQYIPVASYGVGKSEAIKGTTISGNIVLVKGLFIGSNLRIAVSNNSSLGGSEGFTAYVRVREYKQ